LRLKSTSEALPFGRRSFENPSGMIDKQDCAIKTFKRLATRLTAF
jgi:hypothetical protein